MRDGKDVHVNRCERILNYDTMKLASCPWLAVTAVGLVTAGLFAPHSCKASPLTDWLEVIRLPNNPIIRPEMLPGHDGDNINGPSLIRVPAWVPHPLGKYYLYFAHHGGHYIRLAYADHLEGPWRVYEAGALRLEDAPGCKGHIASPDVVIDNERKELRLYFHGPARASNGQMTFVAVSTDGVHFKASDEILGIFYWRVFRWEGWWYAMAKGGRLYRSRTGLTDFEEGPNPFPEREPGEKEANSPGPRHVAVQLADGSAWIYYSNIGDAPERILCRRLALAGDWKTWKVSEPEEILRPRFEWEGARLPLVSSSSGEAKGPENALRDPAIFVEDGHVYLLYSTAGESGIAIAECRRVAVGNGPISAGKPTRN